MLDYKLSLTGFYATITKEKINYTETQNKDEVKTNRSYNNEQVMKRVRMFNKDAAHCDRLKRYKASSSPSQKTFLLS